MTTKAEMIELVDRLEIDLAQMNNLVLGSANPQQRKSWDNIRRWVSKGLDTVVG